jgi:hypothetical protein
VWSVRLTSLQELLGVVSGFANLTHLSLPWSAELDLGFDGGPGCGNFYDGPDGRRFYRNVLQRNAEATELGAAIVAEILPRLESFTIGEFQPTITRGEGGIINMTWPWTGRMDRWLLEIEPEPLVPESD